METPKTEEILYRRVSVKEKGYPKTSGYYFVIDNEFNSTYRFDSGESRFYYGTEYKNPTHWLEPYSDQQAEVMLSEDNETLEAKLRNQLSPLYGLASSVLKIDAHPAMKKLILEMANQAIKNSKIIDDLLIQIESKPSQSQEGEEAVEFAEWIDRCVFNADDETDQFMLSNGLKYFVFDNKTEKVFYKTISELYLKFKQRNTNQS